MKVSRQTDLRRRPPIIVGGVGGSGTRIVASMLMDTGVYMGNLRNHAEDNLWFQLLLKRPVWQARGASRKQKLKGLRLVRDANLGYMLQSPLSYWFVVRALVERQTTRQKHLSRSAFDQREESSTSEEINYAEQGGSSLMTKVRRLVDGRSTGKTRETWSLWGWKEPASFLYLPYFRQSFGDFRYIHVMRHGLDMAFSQNQSQLLNYGGLFSIEPGTSSNSLRSASLKYWLAANRWVWDLMQREENSGRCYALRLEDLVNNTRKTTGELCSFLDISINAAMHEHLVSLVESPPSIGRHKRHDCSIFEDVDLAELPRFGYST